MEENSKKIETETEAAIKPYLRKSYLWGIIGFLGCFIFIIILNYFKFLNINILQHILYSLIFGYISWSTFFGIWIFEIWIIKIIKRLSKNYAKILSILKKTFIYYILRLFIGTIIGSLGGGLHNYLSRKKVLKVHQFVVNELLCITTSNPDAKKLFWNGLINLMGRGTSAVNVAIENFENAIKLDPNFAEAYYYLGYAYWRKSEFDKAIEKFRKATNLDPYFIEAYVRIGDMYHYKGELEKAIEEHTKVIKLYPNQWQTWEAYASRGYIYLMKKKYYEALKDYTQVIKLYMKDYDNYRHNFYYEALHTTRGYIYLLFSKWEKARTDFEKTIEFNKKYSEAYILLGIYYWKAKNNKEKALEYFEIGFQNRFQDFEALYDFEKGFKKEFADFGLQPSGLNLAYGYFIKDLNQTPEFKNLIEKYKKINL